MSIAGPIDPTQVENPHPEASRRGPRVNRRTVLGAAVAGGAGVAAVRLLGVDQAVERLIGGTATAVGGRGDWVSPLAAEKARVNQLLRRATFGATSDELERAFSEGFGRTVDRLLETSPEKPPGFTLTNGFAVNVANLELWWVDHMLKTATPFAERMTLFWHNHFTSDFRKVGIQTPFIYWQNLTWRDMAMTDLRSMLRRVTADPAMLRYLDLATSTGAAPNENYSRELMELFTMGVGHYSEDDVRAAAKGLAGWTLPRPTGSVEQTLDTANKVARRYPTYAAQAAGVFAPRRAYQGAPVKFLGKTQQWSTDKVLDQILAQPATAVFLARKVAEHFVSSRPDDSYVRRLADRFRSSRYDMKTLMREVFTSPEFAADQSYRALVKSPTELMVHVLKALQASQLARLAVASAHDMGQVLFDPPDVGGWPNNDAWISSNTVVARVNFVSAVLSQLHSIPSGAQAPAHLDGIFSAATAGHLNQATDDHARWFLALASPEFQLK
jgi:uncharacterized protein (DUF1800 family)